MESKTERTDKLKDYGIIFLPSTISAGSAEGVCREIIEFNVSGNVDHIQMIVNCSGGNVSAGFAIIDLMEWSTIPIYTTGIGMVASMGLLIFMAGKQGRRVLTPRTSILSHRFFSLAMGSHSQLIAGRKHEDALHERIVDHYKFYSKIKDSDVIEKKLLKEVDEWISPQEALEYGIADIIEPFHATEVK